MRELILLRHAHAQPPGQGVDDADRPLAPEGHAAAEAVGKWLAEHGLHPDCVLCSPARRTRETLAAVFATAGYASERIEPDIYEATPGTLMELIDRHRDVARLMVVGHNPGLERLVALLESGQSGDYRGMPPAGIAVLTVPPDAAFEPGIARLAHFWWP